MLRSVALGRTVVEGRPYNYTDAIGYGSVAQLQRCSWEDDGEGLLPSGFLWRYDEHAVVVWDSANGAVRGVFSLNSNHNAALSVPLAEEQFSSGRSLCIAHCAAVRLTGVGTVLALAIHGAPKPDLSQAGARSSIVAILSPSTCAVQTIIHLPHPPSYSAACAGGTALVVGCYGGYVHVISTEALEISTCSGAGARFAVPSHSSPPASATVLGGALWLRHNAGADPSRFDTANFTGESSGTSDVIPASSIKVSCVREISPAHLAVAYSGSGIQVWRVDLSMGFGAIEPSFVCGAWPCSDGYIRNRPRVESLQLLGAVEGGVSVLALWNSEDEVTASVWHLGATARCVRELDFGDAQLVPCTPSLDEIASDRGVVTCTDERLDIHMVDCYGAVSTICSKETEVANVTSCSVRTWIEVGACGETCSAAAAIVFGDHSVHSLLHCPTSRFEALHSRAIGLGELAMGVNAIAGVESSTLAAALDTLSRQGELHIACSSICSDDGSAPAALRAATEWAGETLQVTVSDLHELSRTVLSIGTGSMEVDGENARERVEASNIPTMLMAVHDVSQALRVWRSSAMESSESEGIRDGELMHSRQLEGHIMAVSDALQWWSVIRWFTAHGAGSPTLASRASAYGDLRDHLRADHLKDSASAQSTLLVDQVLHRAVRGVVKSLEDVPLYPCSEWYSAHADTEADSVAPLHAILLFWQHHQLQHSAAKCVLVIYTVLDSLHAAGTDDAAVHDILHDVGRRCGLPEYSIPLGAGMWLLDNALSFERDGKLPGSMDEWDAMDVVGSTHAPAAPFFSLRNGVNLLLRAHQMEEATCVWAKSVLRALLCLQPHAASAKDLAGIYLIASRQYMSSAEDVAIVAEVLMSNHRIQDAFEFQRSLSSTPFGHGKRDRWLLDGIVGADGTQENSVHVSDLPLDPFEEDALMTTLRSITSGAALPIELQYYLARSRFGEAAEALRRGSERVDYGNERGASREAACREVMHGLTKVLPPEVFHSDARRGRANRLKALEVIGTDL